MDASDLIKALQNTLRGGGRPHTGNVGLDRVGERSTPLGVFLSPVCSFDQVGQCKADLTECQDQLAKRGRYQPGFPRWIGPAGLKATETLAKLPIPSFTHRVRHDPAT
jgi:hypothetical protein